MKSLTSLLSITVLGFGLFGCAAKEEVPIANTAAAAPYGVVGIAYSETLATTCSTVPLPWTVSSGALPTGVSFVGTTGVVDGTPNVAGNFTVVFAGTDSTGKTENCAVSFVVHPRTDRVSVDTFGSSVAGAVNKEPTISSVDGRFIAFTSIPSFTGAALIAGVAGPQILLHDRQTGQPSLISKDNFGSAGIGGASSAASISADGRFIAFVSTATNLVPGVTGQQVYLHDRQTSPAFPNGKTTLVSKDGAGNPASATGFSSLSNTLPRISADGRYIAFVSTATNLAPGLSGQQIGQQIYLHDTQLLPNGQTTLVSKDASGFPASTGSSNISPTISADGRYIAFVSTATNLAPGLSGQQIGQQIYLHDTQLLPNGQTTLVSKDASGFPASTGSSNISPTISADGRYIAFVSTATNLAPGLSGQQIGQQIYLHDTQLLPNGQTTLASKDGSGFPASTTTLPSLSNTSPTISADGQFIAFVSTATNLVPGVLSGPQVYRHDTQTSPSFPFGQTIVVSKNEAGTPVSVPISTINPPAPVVAANGAFVAFASSANNLVTTPPSAAVSDIYVRAIP